jgi:SAM-dependent MidA family methyltransferase
MMLGIEQRYRALSEKVKTQAEADDLYSRIHRLVSPEQMGELFKVLTLHHPDMRLVF